MSEHHETCGCGCGCHHNHDHHEHQGQQKPTKEILEIGFSVLLFLLAVLIKERDNWISTAIFLLTYLLLGRHVLWAAGKTILKGYIFDENFLMSLATLAAFAIGDFAEAVGVMLFFRIGEAFEEFAVTKSKSRIMETIDLRPEHVWVIDGNDKHQIPARDVKVGDVLLVRAGERIPIDGVVLEGESRIDTATVTGEPVPIKVTAGDQVISGCMNVSGVLKIQAEKVLQDSLVTRILHVVEHASMNKPKINRFITRFARIYTPIVVLLAVLTAIFPSLFTGDWSKWIYTAITFLVISCPCAMVLSVPLTFFAGIGVAARKGILFKGGLAIETIQQIKAVVLDKTGTLTKGNFEVQRYEMEGMFREKDLLRIAAECEQYSTHPIAGSIIQKAQESGISLRELLAFEEIAGKGICAKTKDGDILCGNRELLKTHGIDIQGHKIAGGETEVLVACNGSYIGSIFIADTLKPNVKEAIHALKTAGLKTIMLTGDGTDSAEAIAERAGVDEVYANLLPEDKWAYLQKIQNKYGKTMYVGDGINDAPVLAGADVGAAMGNGTDVAIETADVVFMTSSMNAVPQVIKIAKATNRVVIQNIAFALAIKILVMILGILGFANMWLAVFADTGVTMLCVLNSIRILHRK